MGYNEVNAVRLAHRFGVKPPMELSDEYEIF
jgi:hypothetical protein